jgi:MoaA/NifB/PqqE/SkfB family radical SAM enzyme
MRKAFSGSFELHVNTVINKKNMSDLERIIDLLSAFLPLNHKFSMMEPRGKFLFNRDSLLIPPASAAETAIKSLDYGHLKFGSRGMTFGLEGFPLCQICGSEKYIDNLFTHNILLMSEAYEDDFFPVDHGERVFSPVCDRCKSKKNCPGIYKEYFEIFKGRDLTPNL